jgi:SpoVK/Ycf46/Vps4 family AAA+-type ATPase
MTETNISDTSFVTALISGGHEGLKTVIVYKLVTHVTPLVVKSLGNMLNNIIQKRIKRQVENIKNFTVQKKLASIVLERHYDKDHETNTLFDAILSYVSELPQTKCVKRTTTGVFIMANNDDIEISPHIFVRKIKEVSLDEKVSILSIEAYSYNYDLIALRRYLEELEDKYKMALANQLGKNIYYFDEIPVSPPMLMDKTFDLCKAPKNITFSSYVLHTNKSLKNLYGDAIKIVRKRVDFFLNNKRWYEEKGVPYTLGILLHGVPGAGKTSTIKSIAKDTNRHIINVKLSQCTTVSQLNNLFYSSRVHILKDGVSKIYDIPIDKRIIVLEDIDCLSDVVLERENKDDTKLTDDNIASSEKLNLSVILNILDGILEQPGRIIIMTSNHPEKLDKALIRPGRIDVIVKFDYCKRHEIKELIEAFTDNTVPNYIINTFLDNTFTPAEVTKLIFEHNDNIDNLYKNLATKSIQDLEDNINKINIVNINNVENNKVDNIVDNNKNDNNLIDKNIFEINTSENSKHSNNSFIDDNVPKTNINYETIEQINKYESQKNNLEILKEVMKNYNTPLNDDIVPYEMGLCAYEEIGLVKDLKNENYSIFYKIT